MVNVGAQVWIGTYGWKIPWGTRVSYGDKAMERTKSTYGEVDILCKVDMVDNIVVEPSPGTIPVLP